ncbi:uncharacterized protein BDZ83DRAFT_645711 [Colletotrichum acutatum]|uniref:Uncharacterized protein n=1 Tax=Glomerella acutata TaxID=27357 RepID=A0AAD9D3P9_GLOAC|nr:uncharacterized protein BDZ83DRAFT_645711 [Colletotrichum acutatum]KAK1731726.1 hypothetical protein BDZ83DRAFT_645711 [Colletotrichum acutatum]
MGDDGMGGSLNQRDRLRSWYRSMKVAKQSALLSVSALPENVLAFTVVPRTSSILRNVLANEDGRQSRPWFLVENRRDTTTSSTTHKAQPDLPSRAISIRSTGTDTSNTFPNYQLGAI